ncbi:16S rRNA (guanine(966)-N(2))-methyltransferase RsmD [Haliea sp. E1-2-M8]|uniref:16S rRNA (guanine(966)-N(2))-methyltransferase RsmD n=1 Tax=Haliea sp. E1-2-M8 TaxID=3064706 RepID=UPI002721DAA1|nr:16S rRNA (guanine(966)-N(2))-methyltransferase RsmD [Haliea sp. E1-2-M8]MDO8860182.1 16S rRNA (guanine(966)-N(2))-methyltransferase RsmD [Haliea sp. E1-2-M8]
MTGRSRRRPQDPPAAAGLLRIIGGRWRGRKLRFTGAEGLRPTPDRVRETLFNWLAADIREARCLDLFSGSGALGIEALSRGAAHCDFVDNNPASIAQIRRHLQDLAAETLGSCHLAGAGDFLARADNPWDIVFIDPPFGRALVAPACEVLEARGLLAASACVYIETGAGDVVPEPPGSWHLHRDKTAGAVSYRLYRNRTGAAQHLHEDQ